MSKKHEEPERLIIDVARLDKEGERIKGETGEGFVDLGGEKYIVPLGGIMYDFSVTLLGDELLIRGSVAQDARCVCARCGEEFETTFEDEEFIRSIQVDEKTMFLDLTDEAREAIILSFPSYPVCEAGCKGLCPSCGTNLNHGRCSCGDGAKGGAFADLEVMINEKTGNSRNK